VTRAKKKTQKKEKGISLEAAEAQDLVPRYDIHHHPIQTCTD
jgi:hypothetical protein